MAPIKSKKARKLEAIGADEFMQSGFDSLEEEDENTQPSKKKKLEAIGADEFMQSGFDSLEEENENTQTSKKKVKKSSAKEHKKSLTRLKQSDPEFYKFLQENDEELLHFQASDQEDELHMGSQLLPTVEKVGAEEQPEEVDRIEVTLQMLDTLVSDLTGPTMVSSMKILVSAFGAAVEMASGEKSPNSKYYVESNTVFNNLVQICLTHIVPLWQKILKLPTSGDMKLKMIVKCKKWKKLVPVVKLYLRSLIILSASLTEATVVRALLRHFYYIIPFSLPFEKVAKFILNKLVFHWSSGEESVRVLAFLCIMKIVRMEGNTWLTTVIKLMHTEFVKNCKFTSPTTWPFINFMQRCLVEVFMFKIDIGYRHAFIFIRQLAIHLRNAMVEKSKDSLLCVYNWQFVHCLFLWSKLLCTTHPNQLLDSLIYPLVQIIISAIKLNRSPKYFPLHFHCFRALTMISRDTKVFIPVLPFITEILERTDFDDKLIKCSFKPLNFSCMLRLSKAQMKEKGFLDGVIEQSCDSLLEYLASKSHTISFPDLVLPSVKKLKDFLKTCSNPNHYRNIKEVLNKTQETVQRISDQRSRVSFKLMDTAAVENWENKMQQQESPITSYYLRWKKIRDSEALLKMSGKEMMDDYHMPTIQRPQPLKKRENYEEIKELLPSSDEELVEDDDDDFIQKRVGPNKGNEQEPSESEGAEEDSEDDQEESAEEEEDTTSVNQKEDSGPDDIVTDVVDNSDLFESDEED